MRQAENALQEQANRHAWESHAASTQAMVIDEARTASLAHDARIRELELALEVRDSHVAALLQEREMHPEAPWPAPKFGRPARANTAPTKEPATSIFRMVAAPHNQESWHR